MNITEIRITKRGRISLAIDGEYFATVSQESWYLSNLSKGDTVDEEILSELLSQERLANAKRRAINMLSAQSYTSRRLTERIAQKEGLEAAQQAAEKMEELGLLDDLDYARRFAQELYHSRCYAPRRIRLELQKRGVPSDYCSQALEELCIEDEDLITNAAALLDRQFGTLQSQTDYRRAAALLERYGYPAALSRGVLRDAMHLDACSEEEYE